MSASPSRRRTYPHAAARLRRIITALAVMAGGLLAWAGAAPAASASDRSRCRATARTGPSPAAAVR